MPTAVVTIPRSDAETLVESVLEQQLAASVNQMPCTSSYWWNDEIHTAEECILLIKTTAERYDDLEELVARRHPYDVVPIERFDEADAPASFLEWRAEYVQPG
jgi:periplasmic divalent cation tolerance protein